ncbi:MAG: hypothetical protein FJ096_14910 [Deltaproteobacteria bacterium]|nr:hypothetical protein [Deltaproteobacteria bacterium]
MKKPITAGSEIDAYCTKCKMDLNHRVVAMAEGKPVRAECLTCHTQHNYYRPKSAAPEKAPKVKRVSDLANAPRTSTKSAVGQRLHWEKAIAGRTPNEFHPYNVGANFAVGQLVRHVKFGDGVVLELNDTHKVTILFGDGPKLLAQAMVR